MAQGRRVVRRFARVGCRIATVDTTLERARAPSQRSSREARMRLKGKVALITGGGTGIGAATARRFVNEGAKVVVMGRRQAPLEEVAAATGAAVCVGDASRGEDAARAVAAAVERFGGLDVVVANAGGHGIGAAHETDDAGWAQALESNLTSCFVLAREALPSLIERRGAIVVVSSLAGLFAGPAVAGYVTTKHALIGLTRSLARDYGPRGVRVNAVCPGWVRTPMADEQMDDLARRNGIEREQAYALVTSEVPLRRPGEPEDVASICLFLASDEAAIVTGTLLVADGGASCVDLPTLAFERAVT
jgi:NAD(P)-dependent dehydrogenase (short-subunit alcohol dehydrogenase family)